TNVEELGPPCGRPLETGKRRFVDARCANGSCAEEDSMPMKAKHTADAKKTAPVRDWTLLVYLAGDNNLSSAGAVDLEEMKKVGSTDRVNVVAQYDCSG